jgi:hypothetical protein
VAKEFLDKGVGNVEDFSGNVNGAQVCLVVPVWNGCYDGLDGGAPT